MTAHNIWPQAENTQRCIIHRTREQQNYYRSALLPHWQMFCNHLHIKTLVRKKNTWRKQRAPCLDKCNLAFYREVVYFWYQGTCGGAHNSGVRLSVRQPATTFFFSMFACCSDGIFDILSFHILVPLGQRSWRRLLKEKAWTTGFGRVRSRVWEWLGKEETAPFPLWRSYVILKMSIFDCLWLLKCFLKNNLQETP